MGYNFPLSYEVIITEEFADWLGALRDDRAKARIAARIDRVEQGNFGDHKSVGDGLSEMRIDYGPGYRIIYTLRGQTVVLVLAGTTKKSRSRESKCAKEIAERY